MSRTSTANVTFWIIFFITFAMLVWILVMYNQLRNNVAAATKHIELAQETITEKQSQISRLNKTIGDKQAELQKTSRILETEHAFYLKKLQEYQRFEHDESAQAEENQKLKRRNAALAGRLSQLNGQLERSQDAAAAYQTSLKLLQDKAVKSSAEKRDLCYGASWLKHHFRDRRPDDPIVKVLNDRFKPCSSI